MRESHKLVKKSHQNVNLGDKMYQNGEVKSQKM